MYLCSYVSLYYSYRGIYLSIYLSIYYIYLSISSLIPVYLYNIIALNHLATHVKCNFGSESNRSDLLEVVESCVHI